MWPDLVGRPSIQVDGIRTVGHPATLAVFPPVILSDGDTRGLAFMACRIGPGAA